MSASLLACFATLLLAPSPVPSWDLRLEVTKPTVRLGDPVVVRLTLENRAESPQIVFEGWDPFPETESPQTYLRFVVVDGDGNTVRFVGDRSLCPAKFGLDASEFQEVAPGTFFGQLVNLNATFFQHEFRNPGKYRVRAELTFRALSWFEKHSGKGRDAATIKRLFPQRSLLATGTIESNSVEIELVP